MSERCYIGQCRRCRYWQGNRLSHWADCYRVIGYLCPQLFDCKNEFGFTFNVPFDPHDAKYFDHDTPFWKWYNKIKLPIGMRIQEVPERDLYFTSIQSEDMLDWALAEPTVRNVKLKFFQTAKEFMCPNYKDKEEMK